MRLCAHSLRLGVDKRAFPTQINFPAEKPGTHSQLDIQREASLSLTFPRCGANRINKSKQIDVCAWGAQAARMFPSVSQETMDGSRGSRECDHANNSHGQSGRISIRGRWTESGRCNTFQSGTHSHSITAAESSQPAEYIYVCTVPRIFYGRLHE